MAAVSCSRREQRGIERLAVIPFENLTGDATLDWVGAAVSAVVAARLTGGPALHVNRAAGPAEAALEQATRVMQGYFERRGSTLRFHAILRDSGTNRTIQTFEASAAPESPAPAADAIATQTGERLRAVNAPAVPALEAWGRAILATDFAARASALEAAVTADPGFGIAHAELAELLFNTSRRAESAAAVERARPRLGSFGDLERARLELVDAELKGDGEGRRRALVALSRLVSTDPRALQALAEAELNRRDFDAAANYYQNALAINPNDAVLLNGLGYTEAYRGRFDAARTALERYRGVQPDQVNPVDSLGEVEFMAGRFEEAEKHFLEVHRRNPAFGGGAPLLKAAQCRLMRGDLAGADQHFNTQIQLLSNHPRAALVRAQWLYLTGRGTQGIQAMEAIAAGANAQGVYAAGQLAVWGATRGDWERARAWAGRCNQNVPICAIARIFGDPQWIPPDQLQPLAALYRPVIRGDFKTAASALKPIYDRTPPASDGQIRTLYAWALTETGRASEAAKLVARHPLFFDGSDLLVTGLSFPRYLGVRGAALGEQNSLALFKQYSGS